MTELAVLVLVLAGVFLIAHRMDNWPLWPAVLCLLFERLLARWPLPFLVALVLSLPASAAAQVPILERAVELANGSALVAHSADLATTTYCLAAKTCTEANPILAPHVSSPRTFFALKMGVALGSYVVKNKTKRRQPGLTLAVAIAENVAFFWIAKRNYDVHQRAKGQ